MFTKGGKMNKLEEFFANEKWRVVKVFSNNARCPEYIPVDDLGLCHSSIKLLSRYSGNIYKHQHECVKTFMSGKNVCLSTQTASGKTLAFQICANEILDQDENARILAIYPARGLNQDQYRRWQEDMKRAGYPDDAIAKIDGSVAPDDRVKILHRAKVVMITPDVVHAWLLKNAGDSKIKKYLSNLQMLIVDEVHAYSGAFGSNAAYMFRRLKYLTLLAKIEMRVICATATIKNPKDHLSKLFGNEFTVIGSEFDTSQRYAKKIWMVQPPEKKGFLTHFVPFVQYVASNINRKFIAFADNRQHVELAATFADVQGVEPYKSGYEKSDQEDIQNALTSGALKGVVSTSALELGIDIPHLSLGILWGVPASGTSFHQRIGRIGRQEESDIVIVDSGLPHSTYMFSEPENILNMPLTESSLYLFNKRIQYSHALCLATREIGEHDLFSSSISQENVEDVINLPPIFPADFRKLCNDERTGQIDDEELDSIKNEGGDTPHFKFSLRSIDPQYNVENTDGHNCGQLSESQVMREAYPGAIYRYRMIPYRVIRVDTTRKVVNVCRGRSYITSPMNTPVTIYPIMTSINRLHDGHSGFRIMDADAHVYHAVTGFKQSGTDYPYPLLGQPIDPIKYSKSKFSSRKRTSGFFLLSPDLNACTTETHQKIALLLFEMFVTAIPYDRQDVDYGTGVIKASAHNINVGDKFIAIFDQVRGSLRLSSKLIDHDVLYQCVSGAHKFSNENDDYKECSNFFAKLKKQSKGWEESDIVNVSEIEVIKPESVGVSSSGARVVIKDIVYGVKEKTLIYIGHEEGNPAVSYRVPIHHMMEDEDTEKCFYNPETREFKD